MATRIVKLTGLAYWSKVFEDNRDLTGYEDALKDIGGQTCIDMDLDADNLALLRKSKSMKKGNPSPDNDGLTRVRFTRKWTERFGGGAPQVTKADNTPWSFEDDGFIGNGSTVQVTLAVYDTSRKNIVGTRLDKVKVLKHNAYSPDEDDTPPVTKAKAPVQEDMSDDIPF